MQNKTIMVVDDEKKIRKLVGMYLEKEGFKTIEVPDGKTALNLLQKNKVDLLVLDLMMPEMDGWEVCRELRKISGIPIIILTARGDEMDRIVGLELGADDYVVKPFSPRELVARVKAVLRRTSFDNRQSLREIIAYSDIEIDLSGRELFVKGNRVSLTPKEFDILCYLAQSPGRAFSREQLLERVWGYDFPGDTRTVDTHITRLREKLVKAGLKQQYVHTVWGIGYKFEVPSEQSLK